MKTRIGCIKLKLREYSFDIIAVQYQKYVDRLIFFGRANVITIIGYCIYCYKELYSENELPKFIFILTDALI